MSQSTEKKFCVGFPLYNGCTLLDFAGATQIFGFSAGYQTLWLAATLDPITTTEGVQVLPQKTFVDVLAEQDVEDRQVGKIPVVDAAGVVARMAFRPLHHAAQPARGADVAVLEDRQVEFAQRLQRFERRNTGFSQLIPRAIERILASPKADARTVAVLLDSCAQDGDTREALGFLAERFRERDMPAKLEADLRKELGKVLNDRAKDGHDRLHFDYLVLLAYLGSMPLSIAAHRRLTQQRPLPASATAAKDAGADHL